MDEKDFERLMSMTVAERWRDVYASVDRLPPEASEHYRAHADAFVRELSAVHENLSHLDATVDRTFGGIREEMRRGFAETKALIKSLCHDEDSL